jgi:hypothetical protein
MTIKVVQRRWTREEMLALPEWVGQRDTPKRAKKYLARGDFAPDHATIPFGFAVIQVGAKAYRGNGNARSYCHKNKLPHPKWGIFELPKLVYGDLYYCETLDEGQGVYNGIDSSAHGKQAGDRLTSALKVLGIHAKSKAFLSGRGTSGIAIAWNAVHGTLSNSAFWDTEAMVAEFKPEIKIIDGLMNEHNISTSHAVVTSPPFQFGMLMTLYRARHRGNDHKTQQNAVERVTKWWSNVIEMEGEISFGSNLATHSPAIKMWAVVKDDLVAASGKHQRTRVTWYGVAEKVLFIFEHRSDDALTRTNKLSIQKFYPRLAEAVEPENVAAAA